MFIGRRPDNSIYGAWTVRQPDDADHPRQEEVADDNPELVAFMTPNPAIAAAAAALGVDLAAVRADNPIVTFLKMTPAQIDAYVDTNFPGGAAPMPNLRVVLKVLAKVLAVSTRAQIANQ